MKSGYIRVLPLAVVIAVLLVVAGPATARKQQQEVNFAPPQGYPTNEGENEMTNVTNADFGGDKRPDLAVTNTSTNTISVFLNEGDGTFGGEISTAVPCPDGSSPGTPPNANCAGATSAGGPRPMGIVAADFDRDGNTDVAVTSPPTGGFYVFLGNGDGTFEFADFYRAGEGAAANGSGIRTFGIATEDLNRDKRPDVVVTNLGCCSPRFQLPPGSTPNDNDTVAVFLNNPDRVRGQDGAFESLQLLSAGDSASSVAIADLNGDRRPDFAVTNDRAPGVTRPQSNDASVYLQSRNGTFGVPPSPANRDASNPDLFVPNAEYAAGDGPTAIAAADVGGNKRPDLVVANLNSDDVSVLLNDGNGAFAQPPVNYPALDGPRAVTVADFDRDRDLDFAVPYQNNVPGIVSVFVNDGDGVFVRRDFAGGTNSRGITSADFDRDRKVDLAAPDRTTDPDQVVVLLNTTGDD